MIIKSKFKDYYDSGLKYGIDTLRFWIREPKEIEISLGRHYSNYNIWNDLSAVGFCGKIYPFLDLTKYNKTDRFIDHTSNKNKIFYDKNSIKKYIGYDILKGKNTNFKWDNWDKEKFEMEYNELKDSKEYNSYFMKYKTPVFLIERGYNDKGKLTLNCKLKDVAFFKIFNEIEAFSEIEMFIGNILVGEKEVCIPTGDDKVIAASKGFDKWSFRKEPTKKK